MEHHVHQFQHHGDLTTHIVDGHAVSTSIKGLFGAKTFLDHNGSQFARTEPNAFGGKDLFHGPHLVGKTVATKLGYHDLLGGHDTQVMKHGNATVSSQQGNTVSMMHDLGHGFVSVMSQVDPLQHVHDYVMPVLKF